MPGAGAVHHIKTRLKASVTRGAGGLADIADLKESWDPQPETAEELCDVAQDLGSDPAKHVYISARATETEIKKLKQITPV
jgi:hypothetical protein